MLLLFEPSELLVHLRVILLLSKLLHLVFKLLVILKIGLNRIESVRFADDVLEALNPRLVLVLLTVQLEL